MNERQPSIERGNSEPTEEQIEVKFKEIFTSSGNTIEEFTTVKQEISPAGNITLWRTEAFAQSSNPETHTICTYTHENGESTLHVEDFTSDGTSFGQSQSFVFKDGEWHEYT